MAKTKFEKALAFATEAHAGVMRKADGSPFILHPLEVACIVSTLTHDEDVLCAALLHDVVEDTSHELREIEEEFGERVAFLVDTETEDKRRDQPAADTWLIRKQESLAVLREADDEAVGMLWLADKLANMRSFVRLRARSGDAFWQGFNQKDKSKQAWYYREIRDILSPLSEHSAWKEYAALYDMVFVDEEQQ